MVFRSENMRNIVTHENIYLLLSQSHLFEVSDVAGQWNRLVVQAAIATNIPGLSIVPANSDLVSLESDLMADPGRPYKLRDALAAMMAEQTDQFQKTCFGFFDILQEL